MFRSTTRELLWPVVWWARLVLAAPVLAFALGAGGLAAWAVLVVVVIRAQRAQINTIPPSPGTLWVISHP